MHRADRDLVLLTGASGVVGQALVKLLPADSLVCLIHNTDVPAPGYRLLKGDILKPRLGVSPADYAWLATNTRWIIHAAAETNFSEKPENVFRLNVEGTRNVVELAREAGARLCHVSTAFVRLVDRPEPGARANAYARSKAEAEAIVRESGVPNLIVRPSRIVGEARTGVIARFQGFHFLFDLLIRAESLPSAASPDARVDFVPVDSVAAAIAQLVSSGRCSGEYWLTAGERALTLRRMIDLSIEHLSRLTGRRIVAPEPVSEWTYEEEVKPQLLAALPLELRPLLDGVFQMMESLNHAPFPSSFGRTAGGIELPTLPDPETTLLRNLVYWARKRGLVRLTASAAGGTGAETA